MADKAYKIGAIGHRQLDDQSKHYVQLCCHMILSTLSNKHSSIKAVSAIAEGADSLFAQTAISMGIQLESVIPFKEFVSDFQEEESHERYQVLRRGSEVESRVNLSDRSGSAYRKSMEWVIFKSNIIIAIWDGKEAGSIGGTWEAICLCRKLKKKFIHIDITTSSMDIYLNDNIKLRKVSDVNNFDLPRYI